MLFTIPSEPEGRVLHGASTSEGGNPGAILESSPAYMHILRWTGYCTWGFGLSFGGNKDPFPFTGFSHAREKCKAEELRCASGLVPVPLFLPLAPLVSRVLGGLPSAGLS